MARKFLPRLSYSEIEKASTKELRAYYSNLRDIFRKQIIRFAKKYPEQARKYQPGGYLYFGTLEERKQLKYLRGQPPEVLRRDLERAIKELSGLIIQRDKSGAINTDTGYSVPSIEFKKAKQKKRDAFVIKSLHNAGYKHISKSTLKNFGRFMDQMREQYGKKLPNSDLMVEFFDSLRYDVKRISTSFLVDLWKDFEKNDYKPDVTNESLFST